MPNIEKIWGRILIVKGEYRMSPIHNPFHEEKTFSANTFYNAEWFNESE
jgi:hypothetical protein